MAFPLPPWLKGISKFSTFSSTKLYLKPSDFLIYIISFLVFFLLDLVDFLLCFFYRVVDSLLEDNPLQCYCQKRGEHGREQVSETLYERRNIFNHFRESGFLCSRGRVNREKERDELSSPRWSDCCCDSCNSWRMKGEMRLHVVVREPDKGSNVCEKASIGNVIFLHGFLSSSSLWMETVFPNLSNPANENLRMFAVDLLGFGKSPKPLDCLYTIEDHLEMIERSLIRPFQLDSFHLVSHSMGCVLALALAAKFGKSVKSITLIASPYFPSTDVNASYMALNRIAERKVWPPLRFGSSVMSWYEHLGRTICFIFCRNHLKWEWIMKVISRRRDLHYLVTDLSKHTHHSAWHSMHNVICGGAKFVDKYLEVVSREGIMVKLIQGDKDQVVPLECSYNISSKVPHAVLHIIANSDHLTVILGRKKELTRDLEETWFSKNTCHLR